MLMKDVFSQICLYITIRSFSAYEQISNEVKKLLTCALCSSGRSLPLVILNRFSRSQPSCIAASRASNLEKMTFLLLATLDTNTIKALLQLIKEITNSKLIIS